MTCFYVLIQNHKLKAVLKEKPGEFLNRNLPGFLLLTTERGYTCSQYFLMLFLFRHQYHLNKIIIVKVGVRSCFGTFCCDRFQKFFLLETSSRSSPR